MPAEAYIDNNKLVLTALNEVLNTSATMSYNLGTRLTEFLHLDIDKVEQRFDAAIKGTLDLKPNSETDLLDNMAQEIMKLSPYLSFYWEMMAGVLSSLVMGKFYDMSFIFMEIPYLKELDKKYEEALETITSNPDDYLAPYYSCEYLQSRPIEQKILLLKSVNNIMCIKEGIFFDIKNKREKIKSVLEFLYGGELGDSSLNKSLYDYDKESGYFECTEFSVKITPVSTANGNDSFLAEVYRFTTVEQLIKFEIIKAVAKGIKIKICANCGHFFVAYGRADTVYCDFVDPATNKTCSEVGAIKKFKEKTTLNPVFEAFNRAYKRNNAKLRSGKITRDEFIKWSDTARKKRDLCLNNQMELSEFSQWLGNKNR